ncbi:hypothetical protein ACGVWS_04300 [Enterobacteriaceae bacterium LUAb1]
MGNITGKMSKDLKQHGGTSREESGVVLQSVRRLESFSGVPGGSRKEDEQVVLPEHEFIKHSDLPGTTRLSQIAMLGSHDAGTYAFSSRRNGWTSTGARLPQAFKTQKLDLCDQAKAGARYFDIRVAKNGKDKFSFFHGPSVAGRKKNTTEGDAKQDVEKLLRYAAGHKENFYLLKMVFKTSSVANEFLNKVLRPFNAHFITSDDTTSLGNATVDLLKREHKKKNIAILVKDYDKYQAEEDNSYWDYEKQTATKWANRVSAQATAEEIQALHSQPQPENKLVVAQTNMPFASLAHGEISGGVKDNLFSNGHILADKIHAIQQNSNGENVTSLNIVSCDYIGSEEGPYQQFMKAIDEHNRALIMRAAE